MSELSERTVLRKLRLKAHHLPSGNTVHRRMGSVLPPPTMLEIIRFAGDEGVYLIYYDEDHNEITDTFHDTVDNAMRQAEFEFNVLPEEWEM